MTVQVDEKRLLDAFEKAIAEYEVDTKEVVFEHVMDSYDMFVPDANRRFFQEAIDYAEFVHKMMEHLR